VNFSDKLLQAKLGAPWHPSEVTREDSIGGWIVGVEILFRH
jgi:hypothetical protein